MTASKYMNYTVKINIVKTTNEDTKVKGFVNIVFGGSYKVTNISIMENSKTGDLFVSMPRYRSSELGDDGQPIYKDVCNPITKEFREERYKNILTAYAQTLENPDAVLEIANGKDDAKSEPEFSVRMHPLDREGSNVKAIGQVYIDNCFIINNVNIIEGKKGLFVTMPSYKTKRLDESGKAVYQDICYPVTKDFRDKLFTAIQDSYAAEMDKVNDKIVGVDNTEKSEDKVEKENTKDDSKDDKAQEEKAASKRGKRK